MEWAPKSYYGVGSKELKEEVQFIHNRDFGDVPKSRDLFAVGIDDGCQMLPK